MTDNATDVSRDGADRSIRLVVLLVSLALLFAAGCLGPYEKGSKLYDAGEFQDAEEQVRRGLDESPDDAKLNLLMAKIYVQKEDYRKAESYAQTAFEHDLTRAEGGRLLGKIHWELGRSLEAVEVWRETRKLQPELVPDEDYARALVAAIQTTDSSHEWERALALRKELEKLKPDRPEVAETVMRRTRENLAEEYVQRGEYEEAASIYRVLTDSADNPGKYAYERGRLLLRLKQPDKAIEAFDTYIAASSSSDQLERLLEVARRAQDLNAPTVAVRYFGQALETLSDSATFRRAKLRLTVAKLLFQNNEGDAARKQLLAYLTDMRELRGVPLDAEVFLTAADAAGEAGRNGFAMDLLEKALDEAPPNWSIASRLAQQYAVKARQQEAERVLNTYIERAKSKSNALVHAARWAKGRRNYDLAKHYYERLLETKADRPDVWMELGKLYAQLGQIEKMKQALDTFVDKHGENRHDLLDVASIYTDQQLYEAAEDVIEKVRRRNPKSLLVVDRLAELYRKWGKPERIHEAYRRWIRSRGDKSSDYQLVGERLLRRRKLRQALPFLKKAAENGIPGAWLQIADIYQHQRRELDMKEALEKYIDSASNRTRALRAALSRYRATSLTRETTRILEELIQREPGVRSHYERLGETYLAQGRRQAAFDLWRRYVENARSTTQALQTVAGWFEQTGNPELILKFYRHWMEGDQTDPELYRLMGEAYMKLAPRRWTRRRYASTFLDDARKHARKYFRRYLEEASPSRSEMKSFADSMRDSQMWATAAEAYGGIVESASSGSDLHLHYGESLLHLGQADAAMKQFEEYYQARGESPDDAQKISKKLFQFRYIDRAEPYLDRMFSSSNGNLIQAAFVKLAETYQHTGRTDEISGLVTDFLNRAPNPAKGRQLAVTVLERRGLYDEAARQIERIREFQGNVMGFDLGANLFRAGEVEEAEEAFRTHAENSPYSGAVWLKIADFYEAHARPKLARNAYDRAVDSAPDDYKPRKLRGRFLLLQGELEAGKVDFEEALNRASSKRRDMVRKSQIETLRSIGHFQKAADIAKTALKSATQHRDFFLRILAEDELKTGDESRVNRIIERLSSSSLALEDTVELLVESGHRVDAARIIEEELDSGSFSSAGRAMVNRPDVFTRLGGIEALKRAARPLLKQGDSQSTMRAQLGEYLVRQGHYEDGIVYLRSAMEDGQPLYRSILAQTYALLGRTAEATELFQTQLDGVPEAQRLQALRSVGVRLELAGNERTFDTLLHNLARGDDFSGAATGLFVEMLLSSGNLDEALGLIRRKLDAIAAATSGEGPDIAVDDDKAVETLLSAIKAIAAGGFREEAADLLQRLPSDLRDHADVRNFRFHLAATIDEKRAGKEVDEAMEELKGLDARSARERRMEYARVLNVNGHYDLASKMAQPAAKSGAHDAVKTATLFLIRNAFTSGHPKRIDKLSEQMIGRLADKLRSTSSIGNALGDLGLDARSLQRLLPVARQSSVPENVRRALDAAQAAGDVEVARELVDQYLHVSERPMADLRSRFQRAIDRQDTPLARSLLEPYQRTYPAKLDIRLSRARLAFRNGDVEEGRERLNAYLQEVEFEPAAVERVLRFLHENDLWAEQIHLVLEKTDASMLTHKALRYLGYAYLDLDRQKKAMEYFDRAVSTAPDAAQAATDIARTLVQDDYPKVAKIYAARSVERAPQRPAGRLFRGLADLGLGNVETAKKDLAVGLDSGINRLYSLYQAGRAALNAEQPKLASKYLSELAKTPNSTDFGVLLPLRLAIDAYIDTDHAREGVRFIESSFPRIAAGLSIASGEILPQISGLYEHADLHQRAYSIYERGIERELIRNPDGTLIPVYLNNLAYTYSTTNKRIGQGFDLARRAIASARSRTPSYLDTMGWLHYRRGNLERAEADVRRALRTAQGREGDLVELYKHLAQVREARGYDRDAIWLRRFYRSLE